MQTSLVNFPTYNNLKRKYKLFLSAQSQNVFEPRISRNKKTKHVLRSWERFCFHRVGNKFTSPVDSSVLLTYLKLLQVELFKICQSLYRTGFNFSQPNLTHNLSANAFLLHKSELRICFKWNFVSSTDSQWPTT